MEVQTWKKKEDSLNQDIVKSFLAHDSHMICLSELGEIHAGLAGKFDKTVAEWIMDFVVDTAVAQVSVYADAYYVTIVKKEDVVVAKTGSSQASSLSRHGAPFNTSECVFADATI